MGLKVRGPAKGLTAVWAFERPVSTVDDLVRHQVRRLMEELATGAASEFPLFVVGGEVKVKVGEGYEGFVAQAAAVGVQADVPLWPSTIWRAAAARLAGRTFLLLFGSSSCEVGGVSVRLWCTEAAPTV